MPDHVTGDFGLNFELPSCLACFLTVSSAVLQSHWISGSNRFLSGEGTLQRYLYAPSCMCAFPFTNKIKLLRTEISLFYPDTFFLLFFMCFNDLQFFIKSLPSKIHQEASIHPYTQIYLKLTLLFPTNQRHMYFFQSLICAMRSLFGAFLARAIIGR